MAHIIRQYMGAGFGTRYSFDPFDPFRTMWAREQIGDIRRAAEEIRALRRTAQPSTITTSAELPGQAHYIPPAPVSVGETKGGGAVLGAIIRAAGGSLPSVGVRTPDVVNEGQPPVIFSPAPIILPGQTDPGREEQETEEGPMAHTWLHLGSQVLSGFAGGAPPAPAPGALGFLGGGASPGLPPGDRLIPTGTEVAPMYSGGTCAPPKTRTLTIDCATGLEIKRKRRRRRALLTQGDMGVLFQIASLPNSANVRVALAGAIRR